MGKTSLFKKAKNCNLDMQLWQSTCKSSKAKQRRLFYRGEGEVGRDCYKQKVHWRKLEVQSVVAFHWLSCDSLSLAELLPGKEKFFLPPTGSSKIVSLPTEDSRCVSSCWDLC